MKRRSFEGLFYMGWFRWPVKAQQKCFQCEEPADGFCLIVGMGETILLIFCEDCGHKADEWLSKGIRQEWTVDDLKYIASTKGSLATVGDKFGARKTKIKKIREEYCEEEHYEINEEEYHVFRKFYDE